MQPDPKTQTGFDGVAKGVTEIQNSADAAFAFVLSDHPSFDLATALHRLGQGLRIPRQQIIQVLLDPIEEGHVGNRAVFDDLGQTGAEFARRQCVQGGQITQHPFGLVERAHHVFAQRVVDGGFATHG